MIGVSNKKKLHIPSPSRMVIKCSQTIQLLYKSVYIPVTQFLLFEKRNKGERTVVYSHSLLPNIQECCHLLNCLSQWHTHVSGEPNPESCVHLISPQFLLLTQDVVTRRKPYKNSAFSINYKYSTLAVYNFPKTKLSRQLGSLVTLNFVATLKIHACVMWQQEGTKLMISSKSEQGISLKENIILIFFLSVDSPTFTVRFSLGAYKTLPWFPEAFQMKAHTDLQSELNPKILSAWFVQCASESQMSHL